MLYCLHTDILISFVCIFLIYATLDLCFDTTRMPIVNSIVFLLVAITKEEKENTQSAWIES